MNFEQKLMDQYFLLCENRLKMLSDLFFEPNSKTADAAKYSLLNGGKRIRGILVLAICDLLNGNLEKATYFAGAVEMLHAYSLIHDDLPCMDDDDLRRGKPACHIVYGEATALLAGDLLLTESFDVLASADIDDYFKCRAIKALSQAAGSRGMIYGQELDILAHDNVQTIDTYKTGALIHAAAELGILSACNKIDEHEILLDYADTIGLVFQIVDDILDVTSSTDIMGKPAQSDIKNTKNTYVSTYGLEKSKKMAEEMMTEANQKLISIYEKKSEILIYLGNSLLNRID